MKRRIMRILAVLMLALYLLCTACGGTGETVSPQDDPNEGLGGGFDEDAVNDFSEFEGTWLGEANNDYDHIDIDADGNWTLWYGEDIADYGYLRYEPEWGGVYAYSSVDDSGGRLVVQDDGRLYSTVSATSTTATGWSTSGMKTAACSCPWKRLCQPNRISRAAGLR